MTDFRDVPSQNRFEQGFTGTDGEMARVWADYATQGDTRVILHVEADASLRGSGAAGQFMQDMTEHVRDRGLKVRPVCSYAVVWYCRHPQAQDVLAA